jgi:hypothetical protein
MGMQEDDYEDDYWEVPDNLDVSTFDFDWRPSIYEPPYIHQFGTQWGRTGGPRLVVWGARKIKYQDCQRARALPTHDRWRIHQELEVTNFDWSWHPDSSDSICNYAFGTREISSKEMPIVYHQVSGAPTKFMDIVADANWRPLDIVFVSNGETGEEERYRRLCQLSGREVKWVRGVGGRENALRQAARISTTSWFILFPGKLWADEQFDFNFQPTRSHDPKHYIFYARNPLNGLEYGHQAAVCYHRQLVLDTINYGLDFTMSKPHDIVPVNSGVAQYNSDILMTWRTAFREVIKLRAAGDPESMDRLDIWLNYARGEFSEWSLIGAEDGINYYNQVDGDHDQLMLTFEWQWLKDYFQKHHPGIV